MQSNGVSSATNCIIARKQENHKPCATAWRQNSRKNHFSAAGGVAFGNSMVYNGQVLLERGLSIMKSVNIKLSLAENVKSFVNVVNRYPYDVDLRAGRHVVDAKSILGIFSLDLSKPIVMEVYTDSCDDLMEDIKPFMA